MSCEILSVSELKGLLDTGSLENSAIVLLLDSAIDFVFEALGHTFGRAFRVWHNQLGGIIAATVQVTSTAVVLKENDPSLTPAIQTETLTFANYTYLSDLLEAIEALGNWETEILDDDYWTQPPQNLAVKPATNCYGLENRQFICFKQYSEILSGNGESHLFLKYPKVRAVVSVREDGSALSSTGWRHPAGKGWVVKLYSTGSTYSKYLRGKWSVSDINNICVVYEPAWFGMRPGKLAVILRGMIQDVLADTGFKSEKIGDYSYTRGIWGEHIGAYLWALNSYRMGTLVPIPR